MNRLILEEIVRQALIEDLGTGDITSEAIFQDNFTVKGIYVAKAAGVLAGFPAAVEVFHQLNAGVSFQLELSDGDLVTPGTKIATISGPIKTILAGERISLNFLRHLSGIATQTRSLVQLVAGFPVKIVDTRKTTPGLRMLEKEAVRLGGGYNHRLNLADAVLIKDNHIAACGSITEAVRRAKAYIPHTMKVEVETETEAQVREAIACQADIIMLDNMTPAMMQEMVKLIGRRAIVEASGNITEVNVQAVAATGVNIISVGSITHSVIALDISLDL